MGVWVLRIHHRLVAPAAGVARAAADTADVLALDAGEGQLAALDLLRQGGVAQLGVLGHAGLLGIASGTALMAWGQVTDIPLAAPKLPRFGNKKKKRVFSFVFLSTFRNFATSIKLKR